MNDCRILVVETWRWASTRERFCWLSTLLLRGKQMFKKSCHPLFFTDVVAILDCTPCELHVNDRDFCDIVVRTVISFLGKLDSPQCLLDVLCFQRVDYHKLQGARRYLLQVQGPGWVHSHQFWLEALRFEFWRTWDFASRFGSAELSNAICFLTSLGRLFY